MNDTWERGVHAGTVRHLLLLAGLMLAGTDAGIGGEDGPGATEPKEVEKTPPKEGAKRMRWKFGGKGDKKYHDDRAEKVRRIDDWWKAFERDQGKIIASFKKGNDWDLAGWMEEHLQAIDGRLFWEFGPGLHGGHRLVITPEADRFLRPLLSTILERAPKIAGWEFYPYRLAEGVGEAKAMLKARDLASIEATKVRVTRGQHRLIDLEYLSPKYAGPEDREALQSVIVATEVILGEEILDTWIGEIEVGKLDAGNESVIYLERMTDAVNAEIDKSLKSLPDKPAG